MSGKAETIKYFQKAHQKKSLHKIHGQRNDKDKRWIDNRNPELESKEKNHRDSHYIRGNRPRCISEETTTSSYSQDDGHAHEDGQIGRKTRHRPRGCRGRGSRQNRSMQRAAERALLTPDTNPNNNVSRDCELSENRDPPTNPQKSFSYGAAQYRGDRESSSANISKSAHNNFFNKCKMSPDLNISVHTKANENSLEASKAYGSFGFQYHMQNKEYTQMEESDSSLSPSFSRSDRSIAAISLCSSSTSERSIEIASSYSFSDEAEETKVVEKDKLHSLPEDSSALEDASSYSSKSGTSSKESRKRHSECISKNPTSDPFVDVQVISSAKIREHPQSEFAKIQAPLQEKPAKLDFSILPPLDDLNGKEEKIPIRQNSMSFPSQTISRMFCSSDLSSVIGEDIDLSNDANSTILQPQKDRNGGSLFSTSPKSFLMGAKKKQRTIEATEMESILTSLKDDAIGIANSGLKWCYRWF